MGIGDHLGCYLSPNDYLSALGLAGNLGPREEKGLNSPGACDHHWQSQNRDHLLLLGPPLSCEPQEGWNEVCLTLPCVPSTQHWAVLQSICVGWMTLGLPCPEVRVSAQLHVEPCGELLEHISTWALDLTGADGKAWGGHRQEYFLKASWWL